MKRYLASLMCLVPLTASSGAVDDALALQNKPENSSLTVDNAVYQDAERSRERVAERYIAKEKERRAEFNRLSAQQETTSTSTGASTPNIRSTSKAWVCRVYCQSASGPVVTHTVEATTRAEAAKIMDRTSDQVCRSNGYSYASGRAFPERQCSEK
jgi:hypothetical protein